MEPPEEAQETSEPPPEEIPHFGLDPDHEPPETGRSSSLWIGVGISATPEEARLGKSASNVKKSRENSPKLEKYGNSRKIAL